MIVYIVLGVLCFIGGMLFARRLFLKYVRELRLERDRARAMEDSWHRNAMMTHETNASLMMLVNLQSVHIAKLQQGNRDVPARNN